MTAGLSLAVASSPLQLMNAMEWRARRSGGEADLVLLGDRAGGGGAVEALLARRPGLWRRVLRVSGRPRPAPYAPRLMRDAADALHRSALRRLAASLGGEAYGELAFGDYRNLSQRTLTERVPRVRLTLLDDGSITPQAARWRAGLPTPDPRRFTDGWFRTGLARAMLGDPPRFEPPQVTFFTIYGRLLDSVIRPDDRVEPHAFESFRSERRAGRGETVWLLGANHVEARIADPDRHVALVRDGVAALRREGLTGPIVYRPHRGENPDRASRLAAEAGLAFEPAALPIELAYLEAERRPAAVAVIASSAADTLAAIDPALPIYRFGLPQGYLRRQRDHILAVVRAHDAFNPRIHVVCPDAESPSEAPAAL
ncbi:hypothetical protein HNR47_001559 [Methylopila jiangsuensis]|nr:hypothetical protein [Methylopila jiangsuensis]MDR6285558.1 hypothetical protein [Methylopila jiangsuensis]